MTTTLPEIQDAQQAELAAAVETFNAETDPAERVRIIARIRELRAKLTQRPATRFRHDEARR